MKQTLVAVGSHPDDEVLSAGALLLKAMDAGFRLHLVWGTKGARSSSPSASNRWNEAAQVARQLNATFECLELEVGKLTESVLVPKIERILKKQQPHVVVWPHGSGAEQHQDHRPLHDALVNISKRWQYAKCSWLAGQPPVYRNAGFTPNLFLIYGRVLMARVQGLMATYVSERRKHFAEPTFLESRATAWAHEGNTDASFAEPYMLLKGNPRMELFRAFALDFFIEADGSAPVCDYIESLDLSAQSRVLLLLNEVRIQGPELPDPYSRPVSDQLRSLYIDDDTTGQIHQIVYFVHRDDQSVLLHAFPTSTPSKIDPAHLALAEKRREDWLRKSGN
jgi:LmbE family N-acetylglucosaminyl deacetylase/phage-related protein